MLGYDPPTKSVDLLEYLKKQYDVALSEDEAGPEVCDFIEFARSHLAKHPPIQTVYLNEGFGIKLQNGPIVSFFTPINANKKMQDESIKITNTGGYSGQDMQQTEALKII